MGLQMLLNPLAHCCSTCDIIHFTTQGRFDNLSPLREKERVNPTKRVRGEPII